ncbi:cell wall-associated NlpC family hydrolase [Herbihabitans rhizosphaerae]|uniref:Cell wall-associated NlpC family hydrolase n=1 Tax=Herbihabitans rhizosphaerae TaxID=1872711 RepID=A0A4Q7L4V7_9PSEU|nr:NlpC/P60 family protein [Herbihabitans rhizosphaerae]RZS43262.1 cell wall-associated NlpC family hydrolase [Herbihabitans rhizosphaerae]
MSTRRAVAQGLAAASFALAVVVTAAGTGMAVPPPPPNPSDAEIDRSREAANSQAGRVGALTNQLAQAESRLVALQSDVEAKMEEANKALVDLETAQDDAAKARAEADAARRESDGANQAIDAARAQIDRFAAASLRQGSSVGSIPAYLSAKSPEDMLAKSGLLNAVSSSQLNVMDQLERARAAKANKDSLARAALERANIKQAAADKAKRDADGAQAIASQAQRDQVGRNQQLESERGTVEQALVQAQNQVGGLQAQRQRYQDWRAAKEREDAERARAAAEAAANQGGGGGSNNNNGGRPGGGGSARPPVVGGGSASTVISRALAQLGVVYAWGGGNAYGPTRGIADGGVADAHGDYRKIGFDCSGLMIYAFAGVGIKLPHYSGYQAQAGRRVPLSQMRPGDMLFWASGGRIHHVALYIGNGQMVEAPYSGSRVRVTSVRYGGIVPYATRLL